jgi:hypothetical protein
MMMNGGGNGGVDDGVYWDKLLLDLAGHGGAKLEPFCVWVEIWGTRGKTCMIW